MEDLNNKFIDKFKKAEAFIKGRYDAEWLSDDIFEKNTILKKNAVQWKQARDFRNLISHCNAGTYIKITEQGYEKFCKMADKFLNPKNAYDICVKNVYKAQNNDIFINVLNEMIAKNYSNVPIINEKEKVIGVFSSYTLALYINQNNKELIIEPSKLHMAEFEKYYSLTKNPDIKIDFVSRKTELADICQKFETDKCQVLLVNETGKQNEKLLGIITVEDLIKYLEV